MPRQMRSEYPGAIYHVLSRGDQREPIFLEEGDRHDFLKTLGEACAKTGFGVHKALVVGGSGEGYLRTVCDYPHFNPARAKLPPPESRLLEYPWSSFGGYWAEPRPRPKWLRVERLPGERGIGHDTEAGRREFERRMEARRGAEGEADRWKGLRRETTMTLQEIADRLEMGSRKSMAPKLHAWRKANE
jgi:hypothetical protein